MKPSIFRRPACGAAAVIAAAALALAGCTAEDDSSAGASNTSAEATTDQTVTIEDNEGSKEVPVNPVSVVALDNRSFEILDLWGVQPVAAARALVPETIPGIADNEDIVDIGNHREPKLEAIVAAEPQVVISGQRFSQHNSDIEQLVPDATLVDLEPRDGEPLDQEFIRQVEGLGKIFGHEEDAQKMIDDFNAALDRARNAYNKDVKVMAVNVSGGEIGYVAPRVGRTWGPLFDMFGLTPALEIENGSDDHQDDDISVEAIAEANPDFMMVLDRDAGVRTEESAPAQKVLDDSQALKNVAAIQQDGVYIAPADTYTNESIITYTEILNGLADKWEATA
ncbi:ABC transporter substrate-binding protein [Corynebacterium sp. P3-F1]|uniref:siderophore ABC transporter substrate-binding protein n=1 Tax=Corynebacterium sp. P3-F1 TaxID=3059080 RepID=UPI00265CD97A|nr:ABC transporter substrate-binding protein [Corynebacterium sp. P3-F1]WKK61070.1 ABC transporter substrate-binding protein [Corynebacterium sp. P3-F1]